MGFDVLSTTKVIKHADKEHPIERTVQKWLAYIRATSATAKKGTLLIGWLYLGVTHHAAIWGPMYSRRMEKCERIPCVLIIEDGEGAEVCIFTHG